MDTFNTNTTPDTTPDTTPEATVPIPCDAPPEAVEPTPPIFKDVPEEAGGYTPPYTSPYTAPTPVRRVYTAADRTLAWLCWVLGYLFWRWVTPAESGAGVLAFALVFVGVQVWFSWRGGAEVRRGSWTMLLSLVFAVPFFLFGSGTLLHYAMAFFLLMSGVGIYFTYTPARHNLSDLLEGVLTRPFANLFAATGALCAPRSGQKRRFGGVVLGLVIALPLTLIVGALLIKADAAFASLTDKLFRPFEVAREDIVLFVPRLMIAVPVGLYLFGAFYGNARQGAGAISEEGWATARGRLRCVSPAVLLTAGTPLCLLYLLFFISQSAYYFSAFSGLLPADFTYAEYAREGFFQLCTVAVINLGVLLFMRVLARRVEERLPLSLRVYSAVLCGFTLLLIATALRKMLLYIENYGLTPRRVYTSWFMLLLAAIFLVLAVTQFFRRSHAWSACVAVFLVMFAVLQFGNVNGWIARYNVEQYRAGALKTVDVSLFYALDDAAVPYAAELLDDADVDLKWDARRFLRHQRDSWEKEEWITFNLENHRARETISALQKSGALT